VKKSHGITILRSSALSTQKIIIHNLAKMLHMMLLFCSFEKNRNGSNFEWQLFVSQPMRDHKPCTKRFVVTLKGLKTALPRYIPVTFYRFHGSHSSGYEDFYLLGQNTIYSIVSQLKL
jgi:hypothetical protein